MKNLKIALLFCLLCFSITTYSKNTLSAKYHLNAEETGSILSINLSQNQVNQLLVKKYNQHYLDKLNPKELKEIIFNHVKNNIHLKIDGEDVQLTNGNMLLKEHKTNINFVVEPIAVNANEIEVTIPSFIKNEAIQTLFSYSIYGVNDKLMLTNSNSYSAKVYLYGQTNNNNLLWSIYIGLLIASLLLAFISYRFVKQVPELHEDDNLRII